MVADYTDDDVAVVDTYLNIQTLILLYPPRHGLGLVQHLYSQLEQPLHLIFLSELILHLILYHLNPRSRHIREPHSLYLLDSKVMAQLVELPEQLIHY